MQSVLDSTKVSNSFEGWDCVVGHCVKSEQDWDGG